LFSFFSDEPDMAAPNYCSTRSNDDDVERPIARPASRMGPASELATLMRARRASPAPVRIIGWLGACIRWRRGRREPAASSVVSSSPALVEIAIDFELARVRQVAGHNPGKCERRLIISLKSVAGAGGPTATRIPAASVVARPRSAKPADRQKHTSEPKGETRTTTTTAHSRRSRTARQASWRDERRGPDRKETIETIGWLAGRLDERHACTRAALNPKRPIWGRSSLGVVSIYKAMR
jgi:hypothetical protein